MPITKATSNVLAPDAALNNLNAGSSVILSVPLTVTSTASINGNFTVDTNTLFVNAANDRVGIGTLTPITPLHVKGFSDIDSLGMPLFFEGTRARFGYAASAESGGAKVAFGSGWGTIEDFAVHTKSSGNFSETSQRFTVKMNGNVGIGTASPTEKLEVVGNIKADSFIGGSASFSSISADEYIGIETVVGPSGPQGEAGVVISTTPPENTDLLWAQEILPEAINGNAPAIDVNGGFLASAQGNFYEVYTKIIFTKATVRADSSGIATFELRQGHSLNGLLIATVNISLIEGLQEINLNFEMDPAIYGQDFTVIKTASGPALFRSNAGVSYPYDVNSTSTGTVARAVGSQAGAAFYYWFYTPKFELTAGLIYRWYFNDAWNIVAARGNPGPTGPIGLTGPDIVTSTTASDGSANLSVATLSASGNVTGSNLIYTEAEHQTITGDVTVSGDLVSNGTANRMPNQTAETGDHVMTRDSSLRDQMNNMWMPWMFTSSGRTGNRGTVSTIPPALSMGTTNVYQDVLFISIASSSPFHPRGSGAPQRWATDFTFLFEMDTNNQSTANKHLIIGKSPSTVYDTMLPSIGDRCIHVLWIGNNSLQLNLYYNDKVTSSDVVTIPSGLSNKEKYALVWDGTTLSIYGAFWLAWNPQPNLSLRATVSLEEASTNVNMTANEWTFAQTHENDGGLSNSSVFIYYPSFLRRALHPFT